MIAVTLLKDVTHWRVPSRKCVAELFQRVRRYAHVPRTILVSIRFTGDAVMRRLNTTYRGKQKTTDILSFTYVHTKDQLQGDLVISLPQARRQAVSLGHSVDEEILFLLVHGFLHLCGYNHERNKKEKKEMFSLQSKILKRHA